MFDFIKETSMINIIPKLHTASGEVRENLIALTEKRVGAVTLLSVDAQVGGFDSYRRNIWIDPEKGIELDIALSGIVRYMADYRKSQFWCAPFFSEKLSEMPSGTQYLAIELDGGEFAVFVPVVNDTYKCVLEAMDDESFKARIYSGCEQMYDCRGLVLAYAVGKDPLALTECCVKASLAELKSGVRTREERRYPEVFEKLGWCSWDAMQIRVSEQGMLEKCEEFQNKNIPVKWAILDDMWATVKAFYGKTYESFDEMVKLMHSSPLDSFEADPARFPHGLSGVIERIKAYGMRVGVWHPTTGYWRGIAENGDAHNMLRDSLVKSELGHLVPSPECGKSYLYYKTIHDFFRRSGADFVKIDNQSTIEPHYGGMAPIGKLARDIHDGMEASVGEHFDAACINCMGMASEDIWSRSVTPISRCSDDFKPENRAWFAKHILQCAYNSVLQGQFYYCDWDMWWTDDGQARKNSVVRAISGGPIYVSDRIGRSVPEILKPLALSDGSILRCDRPAMPTADCLTSDCTANGNAMKLQNMAGEHGVMAVFNIDKDEKAVDTYISGEQISGFEAEEYAVYEHFSGDLRILKRGEGFAVSLKDADELKLYIFAPISDGFAVIGRTDKFISPKSVKYVRGEDVVLKEKGKYAYVKDGKLVTKEA